MAAAQKRVQSAAASMDAAGCRSFAARVAAKRTADNQMGPSLPPVRAERREAPWQSHAASSSCSSLARDKGYTAHEGAVMCVRCAPNVQEER